jgi:endoglucanase
LTHQGANWVQGSDAWLGTTWSGSSTEQLTILDEFDQAVEWSVDHNRPLYLGEFGCYSKADPTSRLGWTSFIARQAEERNISWGYWNFSQGNGSEPGFGVYDSTSDTWRQPLLETLIPNK